MERLQQGKTTEDWKPIGAAAFGLLELRIDEPDGTFRTICVAGLSDAIYVLHCF